MLLHRLHGSKTLTPIFTFLSASDAHLQAPEPLLPNYGTANLYTYASDINMLALLNAKERTVAELVELA